MVNLHRATERQHERGRKQEVWLTFPRRDGVARPGEAFGALQTLDERHLAPGARVARQTPREGELLTYVREGALAYEDSTGASGVLQAGEFQHRTAGPRVRHGETNASRTERVHFIELWLRPSAAAAGAGAGEEHRRFSVAERRGTLCVVASPDARRGSLLLHQDVLVYSALLDPGQHVVHELAPGRSAWLHVVRG
jgi:redox-sensitive bicupin YhaK (pirin superfamily)